MSGQQKLHKYFRIVIGFMALTPVLCLVYMNGFGRAEGLEIHGMLNANPVMAVTFLTAMLNPFAAYLLYYAKKRLEKGDYTYTAVNLIGLLVIELILLNLVYAAMLFVLLYNVKRCSGLSLPKLLKSYRIRSLLYDVSGSLIMLPIAALCLFAQLRLGI